MIKCYTFLGLLVFHAQGREQRRPEESVPQAVPHAPPGQERRTGREREVSSDGSRVRGAQGWREAQAVRPGPPRGSSQLAPANVLLSTCQEDGNGRARGLPQPFLDNLPLFDVLGFLFGEMLGKCFVFLGVFSLFDCFVLSLDYEWENNPLFLSVHLGTIVI